MIQLANPYFYDVPRWVRLGTWAILLTLWIAWLTSPPLLASEVAKPADSVEERLEVVLSDAAKMQRTHSVEHPQSILESASSATADSGVVMRRASNTLQDPLVHLGNRVWVDANGNGLQDDATSADAADLRVTLIQDGQIISTTVTDASGYYTFSDLAPGVYTVTVALPNDYTVTQTGADPGTAESDIDSDGVLDGQWAVNPLVTLAVGEEPNTHTAPGDANWTVDFGLLFLSIGNYIWRDEDRDGRQDGDEPGIEDVTVELWDSAGAPVLCTHTYRDEFSDESSYAGSDGTLDWSTTAWRENDDGSSTTGTIQITEDLGGSALEVAGSLTISRTVNLALFENGEATLRFDYRREDLEATGNTLNVDYSPDGGATWLSLTVIDGSVGDDVYYQRAEFTLTGGTANSMIRFVSDMAATTDRVYIDNVEIAGMRAVQTITDADGLYHFAGAQSCLEPDTDYRIAISLTQPALVDMYPTLQNVDGITSNDPTGDDADSDAAVVNGYALIEVATTLAVGDNPSYDTGFVQPPVHLGNRVWHDLNNDGDLDANEPGIDGIEVQLFQSGDDPTVATPLRTDITANGGLYAFDTLNPGTYFVYIPTPPPTATVSSTPTDPLDNGEDNDDNGIQAAPGAPVQSPDITLSSGGEPDVGTDGDPTDGDLTVDFGFFAPVSVGNYVWYDQNADGVQDANEDGVADVTVTLYTYDENEQPTSVITDVTGNLVQPLVTDGDGAYRFNDLPPDEYYVVFDLSTIPEGFDVTLRNVGDNRTDSDPDPATGQTGDTGFLISGDRDLAKDMGIFHPIMVGDYVWLDSDRDGLQDEDESGVAGVTVRLYDALTGQPTATDADGNAIDPQITNGDGEYLFENLLPGSYYVVFDASTLPEGYRITTPNAGDDGADSDGAPGSGQTPATGFIESGSENLTLDLGVVAPVAVGDTVWYDDDRDGVQDSDEAGVSGITVRLYTAAGDPAVDLDGTDVAPITTDSDGLYLFENLPPGAYYVLFDLTTLPDGYVVTEPNTSGNDATDSDADVGTGQTGATGFLYATEEDRTLDMGVYAAGFARVGNYVWEDSNGNGLQDGGESGISDVTVRLYSAEDDALIGTDVTDSDGFYLFDELLPGSYYVIFDLTTLPDGYVVTTPNVGNDAANSDGDPETGQTAATAELNVEEQDLTLDLGIYQSAALGDTVWLDGDADGVQEPGEPGLPGVAVQLYQDGALVATETTDAQGHYHFVDLRPGTYELVFVSPEGYSISPPGVVADEALDSDADPATGSTGTVTLVSGENDLGWDAGMYELISLGNYVWYDVDCDGIQDSDEPPLAGVTVHLYTADGTLVDSTLVDSTETDARGVYGFSGLTPGAYYVVFETPAGYTPTHANAGSSDTSDSDPVQGRTDLITLAPDEDDSTWDAGYVLPATLGSTAWLDANQNGIREENEDGLAGVTVTLYNETGDEIGSTLTDVDGHYEFTDLTCGRYSLLFVPPAGFDLTIQTEGDNNSDANPETGRTDPITLGPNESNLTVDVGVVVMPTAIDESDDEPILEIDWRLFLPLIQG